MNTAYFTALNQLNEHQLKAVKLTEGPVMVIAGPGTGKTQILATRIGFILKNTDTQPNNILCLTYTEAGAIAMRSRLIKFMGSEAHKIQIFTFHGFCHKVIRENPEQFGMKEQDPITDLEKVEVLQLLIDQFPLGHPLKKYKGGTYFNLPRLSNLFSLMKRENWTAKYIDYQSNKYIESLKYDDAYIYKRSNRKRGYKAGDVNLNKINAEKEKIDKLIAGAKEFASYQKLLNKLGKYDFEDMLLWVLHALKTNNNLLLHYQEQFLYFLIDEFQDTNGAQNEIVELLTNFWHEPNVFAVGDDDQSIFRFQGANVSNMKEFIDKHISTMDGNPIKDRIVVMTENYRSSQSILDASASLINHNQQRLVNEFDGLTKQLKANNYLLANNYLPEVWEFPNQIKEVIGIANDIKHRINSKENNYDDFAILYIKHKQAESVAQYFQTQDIPINIKRKANVLEQPVIKKILTLLQYINDEITSPFHGEEPLFRLLHFDFFNLNPFELAKCAYYIRKSKINNEQNKQESLKWREALFLFLQDDNEYHQKIKSVLLTLEDLIKLSQNIPIQRLLDNVLSHCNIMTWVAQQPNKLWLIEELNTFFVWVKEENKRMKSMDISTLLETIRRMNLHKISVGINKVSRSENGVHFVTTHSSKGLEFKHVYILGCQNKVWDRKTPNSLHSFSYPNNLVQKTPIDDMEELRRLFFVGMTRAKQSLRLSYAGANDSNVQFLPSAFISDLIESKKVIFKEKEVDEKEYIDYQMNVLGHFDPPSIEETEKLLLNDYLDKYKLSVTHMNNYLECPLKFYYSNFIRMPMAKNVNMEFGSAMHYALEKYFEEMKDNEQVFPSIDRVISFFKYALSKRSEIFTNAELSSYQELGISCLSAYIEVYQNTFNKNVKLEQYIATMYQGIPITGIFDKLEFTDKDINVVDYKTGKFSNSAKIYRKFNVPGEKIIKSTPEYVRQYGGDYWRQAVFYKILLENHREYGHYNVKSAEFDFVESEKDKFHKQKIEIIPEHIEEVKRQIKEVYNNIMNKNFTGCGDSDCIWCTFENEKKALIPNEEDIVQMSEDD